MTSLMKGNVIDGKAVGDQIRAELVTQVAELKEKYGKVPGLAVVIVGRSSEHEELYKVLQQPQQMQAKERTQRPMSA